MNDPPLLDDAAIAPMHIALQHGPRPLPLFLQILLRETEEDLLLRSKALAGLRRYQTAERPKPLSPARAAASLGSARLLHFGTRQGQQRDVATLFVPSLINPPSVLDLSESRSMLRHFAQQGHDPWLIDWGSPATEDASMDLGAHVEQRLIPLARAIGKPTILVGYCLGGTLTLAAAALGDFAGVATIAAPWDFDGLPSSARASVDALWRNAKPMCERLGYVPMEVMQSGFWQLDPSRTIRKYAEFGAFDPGSEKESAFLAVEDWANAGPPLTFAAGRQLFEDLYAGNISAKGEWHISGQPILPANLRCPQFSVRSSRDHIVPAACSPRLGEELELALGHVGMILGGRARELLWNPLGRWLSMHGA